MNWIVGALAATFIVEAVKDKEKILIKWSKRRKRLVFAKGALLSYLLLVLIGAGSISAYKDSENSGNKIDSLSYRSKYLDTTIKYLNDTLQKVRLENKSEQERHENNIRKQDSTSIYKVLIQYAEGVKLGQANTNNILSDARQNVAHLQKKLDSLNNASYPSVVRDIEGFVKHVQSNDTLYLLPCLFNDGGSTARKVNAKGYFLRVNHKLNVNEEYHLPIWIAIDAEIPKGKNICCESKTYGFGIPNYTLDSTNALQFIIVTGTYYKDNDQTTTRQTIECVYSWNNELKKWSAAGDSYEVIKAHNNKSLRKF